MRTDMWGPEWFTDGTEILYRKLDSTTYYQLYKINSSGGGEIQLTSEAMHVYGKNISNAGTRIAYTLGDGQIYTIDADGSNRTQITPGGIGYSEFRSWSLNDEFLTASSPTVTSFFQIYIIRLVDGNETQQTLDNFNHYNPQYSPNQMRIAYTKDDSTGFDQIYVLDPILPPPIPTVIFEVLIIFFAGVIVILLLTIKRRKTWAKEASG